MAWFPKEYHEISKLNHQLDTDKDKDHMQKLTEKLEYQLSGVKFDFPIEQLQI